MKKVIAFFLLLVLGACSYAPDPILIGHDECAYCRMIISEKPFGSQLVTSRAKTYKFDSIECMAAWEVRQSLDSGEIHARWVPLLASPDVSRVIEEVHVLRSEAIRSPMGLYLSAHDQHLNTKELTENYGGEVLNWNEIKDYVSAAWNVKPEH